jgi:hypothetical protein
MTYVNNLVLSLQVFKLRILEHHLLSYLCVWVYTCIDLKRIYLFCVKTLPVSCICCTIYKIKFHMFDIRIINY